jgi:manganese efflux pump family protein
MLSYTIYLIALSLAVDCFVVSVCISSIRNLNKKEFFRIPFHFGLFQGGMTLIGFYLGLSFLKIIEDFDHWIAFLLLLFVGGRMIYQALKKEEKIDKISYGIILLLSIATSIDALAIGITFSIINGAILMKALIIGIFSLVLSLIGLLIGKKLSCFNLHYLEIIGGLVLIGIGVNVLIEHMTLL